MTNIQNPNWFRRDNRLKRRNRGSKFMHALYGILFPEIFNGDGLNTIEKINSSQCFEHGAFVLKDAEHELFNYLYGNKEEITILRGSIIKSLTHLIPSKLTNQTKAFEEWDHVDFIFFTPSNPNGIIIISATAPRWGQVVQYELPINPPVKYICNPQCEGRGLDMPSYCQTLSIGKKKYPKGIIKFYNFTIRYRKGKTPPLIDGPYTYVKFESLSASTGVGSIRHISRRSLLSITKRTDQRIAEAARKSSDCFKKPNSAYCYRAEDYGYVAQENVTTPDTYNKHHNSFPHLENSEDAINQYNSPIHHISRKRIYQLRIGHELFIPQIITNSILTDLIPQTDEIPIMPKLKRQDTLTAEQWLEANAARKQDGGRPRRTRHKTRRRRPKKKSKKRRRTRRKKRRKRRKYQRGRKN